MGLVNFHSLFFVWYTYLVPPHGITNLHPTRSALTKSDSKVTSIKYSRKMLQK